MPKTIHELLAAAIEHVEEADKQSARRVARNPVAGGVVAEQQRADDERDRHIRQALTSLRAALVIPSGGGR